MATLSKQGSRIKFAAFDARNIKFVLRKLSIIRSTVQPVHILPFIKEKISDIWKAENTLLEALVRFYAFVSRFATSRGFGLPYTNTEIRLLKTRAQDLSPEATWIPQF